MKKITETTREVTMFDAKGLVTHLVFDKEIIIGGDGILELEFLTYTVFGDGNYPYQTNILNGKTGKLLYHTKNVEADYIKSHFSTVNEHKQRYFEQTKEEPKPPNPITPQD